MDTPKTPDPQPETQPSAQPPREPSVYDRFRLPGGGYDYEAMEDAGFDVS